MGTVAHDADLKAAKAFPPHPPPTPQPKQHPWTRAATRGVCVHPTRGPALGPPCPPAWARRSGGTQGCLPSQLATRPNKAQSELVGVLKQGTCTPFGFQWNRAARLCKSPALDKTPSLRWVNRKISPIQNEPPLRNERNLYHGRGRQTPLWEVTSFAQIQSMPCALL